MKRGSIFAIFALICSLTSLAKASGLEKKIPKAIADFWAVHEIKPHANHNIEEIWTQHRAELFEAKKFHLEISESIEKYQIEAIQIRSEKASHSNQEASIPHPQNHTDLETLSQLQISSHQTWMQILECAQRDIGQARQNYLRGEFCTSPSENALVKTSLQKLKQEVFSYFASSSFYNPWGSAVGADRSSIDISAAFGETASHALNLRQRAIGASDYLKIYHSGSPYKPFEYNGVPYSFSSQAAMPPFFPGSTRVAFKTGSIPRTSPLFNQIVLEHLAGSILMPKLDDAERRLIQKKAEAEVKRINEEFSAAKEKWYELYFKRNFNQTLPSTSDKGEPVAYDSWGNVFERPRAPDYSQSHAITEINAKTNFYFNAIKYLAHLETDCSEWGLWPKTSSMLLAALPVHIAPMVHPNFAEALGVSYLLMKERVRLSCGDMDHINKKRDPNDARVALTRKYSTDLFKIYREFTKGL